MSTTINDLPYDCLDRILAVADETQELRDKIAAYDKLFNNESALKKEVKRRKLENTVARNLEFIASYNIAKDSILVDRYGYEYVVLRVNKKSISLRDIPGAVRVNGWTCRESSKTGVDFLFHLKYNLDGRFVVYGF